MGDTVRVASVDGSGAMFDRIARRYDLLNGLMSFGLDRGWRRQLVQGLALAPGARVLDVATGTADVALAIARATPRATVVGLDPSAEMLAVGRRKIEQAGWVGRIELAAGDACGLPGPDRAYDAVCISFGIRNVADRERALREMARVTRSGGRLGVLELTEPRRGWWGWAARLHVHHIVPWLGALLSGSQEYRYLQRSVEAFPSPDEFAAMIATAGWGDVVVRPLALGAVHLFTAEAT